MTEYSKVYLGFPQYLKANAERNFISRHFRLVFNYLLIIQLGRATAQAVSRRLPIVAARLLS
jgi:hypothetical protein